MGRPFLYALSAYGEAGVVKTVRILEREIVTGMRLLGASSIKELTPELVSPRVLLSFFSLWSSDSFLALRHGVG